MAPGTIPGELIEADGRIWLVDGERRVYSAEAWAMLDPPEGRIDEDGEVAWLTARGEPYRHSRPWPPETPEQAAAYRAAWYREVRRAWR